MLLADVLERLQTRLQAPFGTRWEEREGVFALTEALRVWQVLTGALVGQFQMTIPAGTVWFNAPRQFISIRSIDIAGVPLTQYTSGELDREFGDWEAATPGTVLRWAPEGAALVALNPPPATAITLTLTGFRDVPTLAPGDSFEVGDEDLTRLLAYGQCPYLAFKEGPAELETETISLLVKAAGEKNAELRNSDFYKAYAGRDRVMAGGQEGKTELGEATLGVRS